MFVLCTGATGVLVGGILPLVLLVPFYLGAALACLAAMVFMFSPAVYVLAKEWKGPTDVTIQRNSLAYKAVGAALLVAALLVFSFVAFRGVVNRAKAAELTRDDPIEKAQRLGQNYAYRFNRLSQGEQRAIIERLLSSPHAESVLHPSAGSPSISDDPFVPVAAFSIAGSPENPSAGKPARPPLLFVAARLSEKWKMMLPSRVQGPRNSLLFANKNVAGAPPVHYYLESPEHYVKIADPNWDGRYRMFCLPQSLDLQENEFLYVGAYNFKDGEHGPRGLILESIGGNRFYRQAR